MTILDYIALQCETQPQVLPLQLPTTITLLAIEQTWEVLYLATASPRLKCVANQSKQIKFLGDITNKTQCLGLLRQWLKKIAQHHLSEQLHKLAVKHNLPFNQLRFRHNSTRWGSCSTNKDISLCCNLLFLPPSLVQHVLLHELCHTKVMNHGVQFWKLLEKLDQNCQAHKQALKQAHHSIPAWA
ncbi:MAG: zinc protease [Gammaproteobacteria bacterium]|jgi:predicted metal-dependent hydrolase|nr:zinc protease [Gammaproteobacteria bacterium]